MRKVSFLIAGSPTEAFYSQVAALAAGMRRLPWSTWQPSLHLFLGGNRSDDCLSDWRPYLQDVEIFWTSDERYFREGAWAQSDDVFRFTAREADIVVALDADTFPVAGLELMLSEVQEMGGVAGVIAHYPAELDRSFDAGSALINPDYQFGPTSTLEVWAHLAKGLIDAPLDFGYVHTLLDEQSPPGHRPTPFYLNFGVVVFARQAFDAVAPRYLALRPPVMERMRNPDFSGQVALTLAIANARVQTRALPMRFNFPNDHVAEAMYPREREHVTVIHYLRTDEYDRHLIFADAASYDAFLQLPLTGVGQAFQHGVASTLGVRYPFPRRLRRGTDNVVANSWKP